MYIFATSSPVYLLALLILGTFNDVSGLLVVLLLLPPVLMVMVMI